jgi:hypothetical protein
VYPPPKRRWPGLVAAYTLLSMVLALPGVPLYYYLDPIHKPLMIRGYTGVFLAFALYRLVRSARKQFARQFTSDFATAIRPRQEVVYLAPAFEKWQRDVTHGLHSRWCFTHILRPRLLALWEHQRRTQGANGLSDDALQSTDKVASGPLAILWHEPRRRFHSRRGISLRTLRALIQTLEARR